MPALTTRLAPAGNEWAWVTDGTRMNGSKSELLAIDAVTASYQGCNAMRLVGNGTMEFVWQGLCSIAGGYVRRAYNSAQWDEVPCAFVPAAMRRPRACSSRRSGLVTALCAAVGIAFLLPPPPAFAQSTTLVSNLDRLSTLKPAAGIYAQGFRTGAHTAGYTIRNVQVRLRAGSVTSSTKTSVLIRQERNGEPGALVTALTTQMPLVDGVNTFAAPANTTLNPQTNYFITVNEATPTRTCYERTSSDGTTYFICEYEGAGWPRAVTHPRLPRIRACPIRAPGSSDNGLAAQRYTLCTTRTGGRG